MKKMIVAAMLLGALTVTGTANAQARVIGYTANQKARITQGVRHGSLTRNESRFLNIQMARINAMKRMAMADGTINQQERLMIRKEEQRLNFSINREKHDRDFRS